MRPLGEAMSQAYQVQGQRQQTEQNAIALQQQQRALAAQKALQDAIQASNGDYDAAVDALEQQGFGDLALTVRKSLFDQRIQQADLLDKETKTTGEKLTQASQLMQSATDPISYMRVLPRIRKLVGPELAQQLPDQFDPAFVQSAVQWGMKASDVTAQRNAAVAEAKQGLEAKQDGRESHAFFTGALSKWLTTVDSPEEWTQALQMAQQMGAPKEVLAQFAPEFSPQAVEQAKALGMSPEEREQLSISRMNAQTSRASAGEQARHNRVMEAKPVDDRLVQIMGPNGTPIWVAEHDAIGQPAAQAARAVTGAERQSLAYFNRAKQASDDIAPLENDVAKMGLAAQGRMQYAPNFMQSQTGQQYRQAQRSFTEARLRKESGAAIPTAEYENDAKTYFAQPGDTPQTLAQKRAAREKVLEGLGYSAGKAYEEFYGEPMQRIGAASATIKTNPFKK